MSQGFICKLTGYCPASVAPDNAPMVGLDLKNNTVTRQITPEDSPIKFTFSQNLSNIKDIKIEEPMTQDYFDKNAVLTVNHNPVTYGETTSQTTTICRLPHNLFQPRCSYVTNTKTVTPAKTIEKTKVEGDYSWVERTIETGADKKPSEAKYQKCFDLPSDKEKEPECFSSSKEEFEEYKMSNIPHFNNGELIGHEHGRNF